VPVLVQELLVEPTPAQMQEQVVLVLLSVESTMGQQ
jgi:hypothetical protein